MVAYRSEYNNKREKQVNWLMITLEFRITGEVGIVGGLDIVIIIKNRGVGRG